MMTLKPGPKKRPAAKKAKVVAGETGDDDDAEACFQRAEALRVKNQFNEAIKEYDKAIKLNPKYALAYGGRGEALRGKNQYDKAIEDYTTAIKLSPNYVLAYAGRGSAYRLKGNSKQAASDLKKALELNPGYDWAKNELKLVK